MLLWYALVISTAGFAKDPCTVLGSYTDPFGALVRQKATRYDHIIGFHGFIRIFDTGGSVGLTVEFVVAGEMSAVVPAGSVVKVALPSGATIDLTTTVDTAANVRSQLARGEVMQTTCWKVEVPLSKENIAALVAGPRAFRTNIGGSAITVDISQASTLDIVAAATCLAGGA